MIRNWVFAAAALVVASSAFARDAGQQATEATLAIQNANLEKNTTGKGFGPQSPRDLAIQHGTNKQLFSTAPPHTQMNLCNIHFHKNAEHRGGEFTAYAGHGDGHGYGTGFRYSGKLSPAESKPLNGEICKGAQGGLKVGDTIEVHYVHSSAQVLPGPTLNYCLRESDINPQLRVEALVLVLVNDSKAADFNFLTKIAEINGYQQAPNIPMNTGKPIAYEGSTTGPDFNEKGSSFQVSWNVRPKVVKVNAESVGQWCKANIFKEYNAYGARNLVTDEKLLSRIR